MGLCCRQRTKLEAGGRRLEASARSLILPTFSATMAPGLCTFDGHTSSRTHDMMYHVATAAFEGPLDLLLQLINRHQVDIATVSLTDLVTEYLSYLDELPRWIST